MDDYPDTLLERLSDTVSNDRVRRFWILGVIAIFLHGVLDPLTTFVAIVIFDVGVETNAWLAQYLERGLMPFTIIHLPFYIFVMLLFVIYTWLIQRASGSEAAKIDRLSVVVWGLIIIWGCFLVGNNLLVLLRAFA